MFTAFQLLDKINTHVSELQFTRSPKGLYAPVEYVLSLGGKRIRPVPMCVGGRQPCIRCGMTTRQFCREMPCWCLHINIWPIVRRNT